jgi:hypothetical protein
MNPSLSRQLDNEHFLAYSIAFRNRSSFTGWVASNFVRLLADLDPTNSGKERLAKGSLHYWQAWGTEFISRPQGLFTYGFTSRYGGFYDNGTRLNLTADLGYRVQPFASLALSASYNRINLPELSGSHAVLARGSPPRPHHDQYAVPDSLHAV